MKKIRLIGLFALVCVSVNAQIVLSDHAQISLLTCAPSDKATWTLFGHTAIRVRDTLPNQKVIDSTFNYGDFDYSESNFIYRFAKGETYYMLGVSDYEDFLFVYRRRGSAVYEQTLNLDKAEKEALWQALVWNAQPENRVYLYSFFFDNCATRPAALIERITNGRIEYDVPPLHVTLRELLYQYSCKHQWFTFGYDLAIGVPADRSATLKESFFLPEYLKTAYDHASIVGPDGSKRPLVSSRQVLLENRAPEYTGDFPAPMVCGLLLLAAVICLTLMEWRKKKSFRWLDCTLFLTAGVAGCVVYFLCFVSIHPCLWPNLSVMWLHPFHLVGVVLFAVKKLNKAAYCYHFINFVAILLMSGVWIFIPQHLNAAFVPLIACLLIRSGYGITRKKEIKG